MCRSASQARWWPGLLGPVLALVLGVGAAGCGGGSTHHSPPPRAVTLLMARQPGSLDPAAAYTPQALQADWLAYTPLLTYVNSGGTPGTVVIPALVQDLPKITDSGKIYSFTLRQGLTYSNGQPVRASDFIWAVKRAIKLWPLAPQLLNNRIVGAGAFAAGRTRTISGITADDAAGLIRIYLTAPYGAIENVLASPALAPVPTGTPLRDEASHPPPGIGQYKLADVVVGKSFSLVKNPLWQKVWVPYLPLGNVNVDVRITGDEAANAASVLNNQADVFDFSDEVPASLLPAIEAAKPKRYYRKTMSRTDLIFLNGTRKPFSSQLAREAVQAGLNQNTLVALDGGKLLKGCYLLPPSLYGHPHDACPNGNKAGDGNLPAAQALARQSGMLGTRVTVWAPAQAPFAAWMSYYTSLLNQIGFKATLKTVPPGSYYETVGDQRHHAQTGFQALNEQFPNPAAFYEHMTGDAIRPTGNQNLSEVNDPYVNSTARVLSAVPASNLDAVASFWHELDLYLARHAYVAVLGYPTVPEFVSERIKVSVLDFSPVVGFDWSSFKLR